MKVSVETITPEIATEMLKGSDCNFRKTSARRVRAYSKSMQRGEWDVNGESIKLNGHVVLDGKHRLSAVVHSGVSIETLVCRDVDSGALNIDNGKPRSLADWLKHSGIVSAVQKAAVVRLIWLYERGSWMLMVNEQPTHRELVDLALRYDAEIQSALYLATRQKMVTNGLLTALLFFGCGKGFAGHNSVCRWFSKALATGEGLTSGDPVLALRNQMIKSKASHRKLTKSAQVWIATVAWNKTALGEEAKIIHYNGTGPLKSRPIRRIEIASEQLPGVD